MPLSIDEAETRCTLTGKDCAKGEASDEPEGKRFPENSVYLWNFYKKPKKEKCERN
jgi:hypothetical protein